LDGLDVDMSFARKADATAARLSALPSIAMLTSRVDLDQAGGLSGLRSRGRRRLGTAFEGFRR